MAKPYSLTVALAVPLLAPAVSRAVTLDMEFFIPPTQMTNEGGTRVFGDFEVYVSHGHYMSSDYPIFGYANNGTNWLLADNNTGVTVTSTSGPFSLQSFQATEFSNQTVGGNVISVTGTLLGGGVLMASFSTATRTYGITPSFQTFSFGSEWTGLTSVNIEAAQDFTYLGFDNVVVNEATSVPDSGSTLVLAPLAMIGVAGYRFTGALRIV